MAYKYYKINVVSVKSGSTFRATSAKLLPDVVSAYRFGNGFTKVDGSTADFYLFYAQNTPHQKTGLPATIYFSYASPTSVTQSRLTGYDSGIDDTNANRWELYGSNVDLAYTNADSSTSGWTLLDVVDPATYVNGHSTSTVDYYIPAYKQPPNTGCSTQLSIAPPPCSIMAFLGIIDPDGWVICDGQSSNNSVVRSNADGKYNNLIVNRIGTLNNGNYIPPDYRGAFLRGTGTSGNYTGPNIGSSQTHATQTHSHNINDPGHVHNLVVGWSGGDLPYTINFAKKTNELRGALNTSEHIDARNCISMAQSETNITIQNSTTSVDANETRPFNFGVNWIIKL